MVDTGRENGILDYSFLNNLEQLKDYALEQNNISGRPYTGKITSILDVVKKTKTNGTRPNRLTDDTNSGPHCRSVGLISVLYCFCAQK